MMEGFKFDLNNIGYFFWFVLMGLVTIIFSIIYRAEFIFFGASLALYGMLGFFLDLLIDRIISVLLKKNLTVSIMHEVSIWGHLIRFLLQLALVLLLVWLINTKYQFLNI